MKEAPGRYGNSSHGQLLCKQARQQLLYTGTVQHSSTTTGKAGSRHALRRHRADHTAKERSWNPKMAPHIYESQVVAIKEEEENQNSATSHTTDRLGIHTRCQRGYERAAGNAQARKSGGTKAVPR